MVLVVWMRRRQFDIAGVSSVDELPPRAPVLWCFERLSVRFRLGYSENDVCSEPCQAENDKARRVLNGKTQGATPILRDYYRGLLLEIWSYAGIPRPPRERVRGYLGIAFVRLSGRPNYGSTGIDSRTSVLIKWWLWIVKPIFMFDVKLKLIK